MTYARPTSFATLGLCLAGLTLLGAGGCADPCLDDGLGQKSCPSNQEAGGTAEESNSGAHEAEGSEAEGDEAEGSEAEGGGACSNQTKDEGETDVDCGGVCVGTSGAGKCDDGQMCEEDDDCVSDLCEAGVCVPRFNCSNGTKDEGETDVDCGGECVVNPSDPNNPAGKCDDGESCEVDSDCVTDTCDPEGKVCVSVCSNGVFDPGETDVDCGGHCVFVNPEDRNDVEGQCNDMDMCVEDMDCVAGECSDGQCDVCSPQGDYTVCQTCLVTNCCPSVQACLADIPKCVCWFNCIGQPGATVQGCMTSCGNGNIGTINSCLNNACKNECQ